VEGFFGDLVFFSKVLKSPPLQLNFLSLSCGVVPPLLGHLCFPPSSLFFCPRRNPHTSALSSRLFLYVDVQFILICGRDLRRSFQLKVKKSLCRTVRVFRSSPIQDGDVSLCSSFFVFVFFSQRGGLFSFACGRFPFSKALTPIFLSHGLSCSLWLPSFSQKWPLFLIFHWNTTLPPSPEFSSFFF